MLEAISSPGSAMDDKTIVNMKAGKADSAEAMAITKV